MQIQPQIRFLAGRVAQPEHHIHGKPGAGHEAFKISQRRDQCQGIAWFEGHRLPVSDLDVITGICLVVYPQRYLINKIQVGITENTIEYALRGNNPRHIRIRFAVLGEVLLVARCQVFQVKMVYLKNPDTRGNGKFLLVNHIKTRRLVFFPAGEGTDNEQQQAPKKYSFHAVVGGKNEEKVALRVIRNSAFAA